MTVPSKSKNAPTRGPRGPASTSASSCSSVHSPARAVVAGSCRRSRLHSHALPPRRGVQLVDDGHPADDVAHLGGPLLPAAGQLLAARVDQVEVAGQLQRAARTAPATATRGRAAGPAAASAGPTPPHSARNSASTTGVRGSRAASRSATTSCASTNDRSTRWAMRQRRPRTAPRGRRRSPSPGRAAPARRRAARGRRPARGRRTRTSAGRAAASPRPSGRPGRRSRTSSAIARSTKWWIALLR